MDNEGRLVDKFLLSERKEKTKLLQHRGDVESGLRNFDPRDFFEEIDCFSDDENFGGYYGGGRNNRRNQMPPSRGEDRRRGGQGYGDDKRGDNRRGGDDFRDEGPSRPTQQNSQTFFEDLHLLKVTHIPRT